MDGIASLEPFMFMLLADTEEWPSLLGFWIAEAFSISMYNRKPRSMQSCC